VTASSLEPSTGDLATDDLIATDLAATGLASPQGASLVVSGLVTTDLVRIAVSGGESTVRLSAAGEIDSSSASVVRTEIDAVLGRPVREVVLDLDEVTFLDSAGLSALAAAHRLAGERGVRLRVLASGRAVIRPLQITGLWDLLGAEQIAPGTGRTA
jgi:anti-sigma B factor antagonist